MTESQDPPTQEGSDLDPAFKAWPKIPRLSKEWMTITEKMDGTNAQILILPDGTWKAGSRNRWLSAEADNYGFHSYVAQNIEELRKLGHGRHYGEWYGVGIQRGYGIFERRFALFNVNRPVELLPKGVTTVPLIYRGPLVTEKIEEAMEKLRSTGSVAVPGFMKPEGIVVNFLSAKTRYKRLLENDGLHKGEVEQLQAA